MAMNAIEQFKARYAKADVVAADMTAAAETALLDIYDATYAKVYRKLMSARSDDNYATVSRQKQLMRQVGQELEKFQAEFGDTLKEDLRRVSEYITGLALKDMGMLGVDPENSRSFFYRYNEKYVEQVFKDNFMHVAAQTEKMSADFKYLLRTETSGVMRKASVEGMTRKEATKSLMEAVGSKEPSFKFVDRAGRAWDSRKYFEMLSRTLMMNAQREVYINTMTANRQDLAIISSHNAKDACRRWEGRVISLTGATEGYPTLESLMVSGEIFHPRCRHLILAFNQELADAFGATADTAAKLEAEALSVLEN